MNTMHTSLSWERWSDNSEESRFRVRELLQECFASVWQRGPTFRQTNSSSNFNITLNMVSRALRLERDMALQSNVNEGGSGARSWTYQMFIRQNYAQLFQAKQHALLNLHPYQYSIVTCNGLLCWLVHVSLLFDDFLHAEWCKTNLRGCWN